MDIKYIELNVEKIVLDVENPRHDLFEQEDECISFLSEKAKVTNLANDIVKQGGISPLEIIGVIQDKNKYIVIEGNRRLCALKLLHNSKKAENFSKPLAELANNLPLNFPKNVQCAVFQNREDANIWIERKHSGEQNGIGPKTWGAKEKTRHNQRNSKKDENALSLALFQYIADILNKEIPDKFITTATRCLGNPVFRKAVGICAPKTDHNLKINVKEAEFKKIVTQFYDDLISGEKVNSRSNKQDIKNYIQHLKSEGLLPTTISLKEPITLIPRSPIQKRLSTDMDKNEKQSDEQKSGLTSNQSPTGEHEGTKKTEVTEGEVGETGTKAQKASIKNPLARKYIISNGHGFTIKNKKIKRFFDELKQLEVKVYPLATALLSRTFLEAVYRMYHQKEIGSCNQSKKMGTVLNNVINDFEKNKNLLEEEVKSSFKYLKKIQSDENRFFAYGNLSAIVHGDYLPTVDDLKTSWDNLAPILKYMVNKID